MGRPSLREEQKTVTRNRVLDAAVDVFREKSVVDATLEDIARAAGVTRVTVYAHFGGGKGDIIRALTERVYDTVEELYAALAATAPWNRRTVRSWLEAAAAHWREMAPTIRVLTAAGPIGDAGASRDRYLTMHDRFVTLLTEDSRRWRNTSPAEAKQRALLAALQLESFLSVWTATDRLVTTEDPLALLTDALCHLLGPALDE